METAYDGRQVVGMDLHRRRGVPFAAGEEAVNVETSSVNPLGAMMSKSLDRLAG